MWNYRGLEVIQLHCNIHNLSPTTEGALGMQGDWYGPAEDRSHRREGRKGCCNMWRSRRKRQSGWGVITESKMSNRKGNRRRRKIRK